MKRFFYILACSLLAACGASNAPYDLRCENLSDPLAVDSHSPRLSWKMQAGDQGNAQTAYQILVASDSTLLVPGKADLWDSGKTQSIESVLVPYGGKPLPSGSQAYWQVKIWDQDGKESAWSRAASFGIGLLEASDWKGNYIGLDSIQGNNQCPILRSGFEASPGARYLIHVNSLGYHELYLNGMKVGNEVLSPSVSQTGTRSLAVTYDLTPYIAEGYNDLAIWLGQGWYRPGLPFVIHSSALVKAQVDEYLAGQCNTVLSTNSGWKACTTAYIGTGIWRAHQFGGEWVDGAKMLPDMSAATLDKQQWSAVAVVEVPAHKVSPRMTEPNVVIETLKPATIKPMGDSIWLVDMGRVFNGMTRIDFPQLAAGQRVIIEYSDHMNEDGSLYLNERQEDRYFASGAGNEFFANKFNHHAYQYILITGLKDAPTPEQITGSFVTTAFRGASSFECSDKDLNAIHDLVQYTLKCLTLGGYMVDCPHIERLGYGGDGHGSTVTAHMMYDMHPLYSNWMQAWGDVQQPDGGLPHTAPEPYKAGGGPYWCAFIVSGPWDTYQAYGDKGMLEKYYPNMQKWFDYVKTYSVNGLLKQWPETEYRTWYLGDWACPTGVDQTAPVSIDLVSNCVVSETLGTMVKVAHTLGREQDAAQYAEWKKNIDKLIHDTFFDAVKGSYGTGTQIDQIYPMLSGVTPGELIPAVEKSLMKETFENRGGHIACGLVGIPVMVDWAVKNHKADFIYQLLKKRDYPGYLYMVDQGATATWEHWDGFRSRVHNCYNGIGSWFYQAVGGIRPDETAPGYRHALIDVQIPSPDVTWARSSKETPYGTLAVNWTLKDKTLSIETIVPAGCTASVMLPEGTTAYTFDGKQQTVSEGLAPQIGSGKHTISYGLK